MRNLLSGLFSGRANRTTYVSWQIAGLIAYILAWLIVTFIANTTPNAVYPFLVVFWILYFFFMFKIIGVSIQRLHDIGMSAWYMLLLIIPLVNIIMWLVLVFKSGNDGANRYGYPPGWTGVR